MQDSYETELRLFFVANKKDTLGRVFVFARDDQHLTQLSPGSNNNLIGLVWTTRVEGADPPNRDRSGVKNKP